MRASVIAKLTIPALALALAACGSEPETPAVTGDDERTAKGEVLGGTISDAMLPLGETRSQPATEQSEDAAGAAPSGASDGPASGEPASEEVASLEPEDEEVAGNSE